MRKSMFILGLIIIMVASCAPVLKQDFIDRGSRDIPFEGLKNSPASYTGKLYILGGVIIDVKTIDKGFLIDALYVPVDHRGFLAGTQQYAQRYLALYPKGKGNFDASPYRSDRAITIAGTFRGIAKGKVGEKEYQDSLFEIEEIYLWPENAWPVTTMQMPQPKRYNFWDHIFPELPGPSNW